MTRSGFAENIGENIVQLNVGNGKAVLGAVLLSGAKAGQFDPVAHEVSKLSDLGGRNKTPRNKAVLEDVCNPLSVLRIRLFASDSFDIFRVCENYLTGLLQDIVDGNPILSGGFHTNIVTIILGEPIR